MQPEDPTTTAPAQWGTGYGWRYDPTELAELATQYPQLREHLELLAQVGQKRGLSLFSQQHLRLALIALECLHAHYSEVLTLAITSYLAGAGSLEQLDQPWPEADEHRGTLLGPLLGPGSAFQPREFDAIDLRILDLCLWKHDLSNFLISYAHPTQAPPARLQQICDDLYRRELEVQTFLDLLADERYGSFYPRAIDAEGNLTPLGHLIRSYLPAHLEQFDVQAKVLQRRAQLIQLLLAGPDPLLDLARTIAERGRQGYGESGSLSWRGPAYYYWALGQHLPRLLKADPERFTPLARQMAGPESPAYPMDPEYPFSRESQHGRLAALQALLAHDPARHIDLAVEAIHAPFSDGEAGRLQCLGLTAAYQFDPARFFPLVEEAALSPNQYLSDVAVEFLVQAPFEQARQALQRCVAEGHPAAALKALPVLLSQSWEGQTDFACALLTDRFEAIRALASQWLVEQGKPLPEVVDRSAELVHTSWQRIEAWLGVHAPHVLAQLPPGAADEDIRQLEVTMGFKLSAALQSLLQRHNGTAGQFVHTWAFLSTTEITQAWQMWINVEREYKQRTGNDLERLPAQWMPLASDGLGNHLCVDLAGSWLYGVPLPEGQSGQVFYLWHDDVDHWLAPSFETLWSDFADELEAGSYYLDEFRTLQSDTVSF